MNINITFLVFMIIAFIFFFIGLLLVNILSSQLREEDFVVNSNDRRFSRTCKGIYTGIVFLIIGCALLPIGTLTLLFLP